MKSKIFFLCIGLALMLTACSKDETSSLTPPNGNGGNQPGGNIGGGGISSGTGASIAGLTDFTVAFDKSALSESESVPAGDANYVENANFDGTINILYKGLNATVSGAADDVATVNGADVTINSGSYKIVLSGTTTDGSLTVASASPTEICLNGVTLTNADGAAINFTQKKSTAYIVANDGTENILTDGSRKGTEGSGLTDDPKVKSTIFTKGKAIFSGKGTLTVHGNYKNGIDTKKCLIIRPNTNIYASLTDTIQKGSCIKCENTDTGEGFYVKGGVLNLSNPTVAGKGLASDGELTISGGRITAICTGTGMWDADDGDVSGSACIKCDSVFTITAGNLWLKSTGSGGKGINGDSNLNFNGGTVHVITTGATYEYTYNKYTYDTSPKGIKTDKDINVTDGEIYVCATGTTDGSEGIEAKQTYQQSGGGVKVYAADDALNTGYSSETLQEKINMGLLPSTTKADQGQINISGGTIYLYSTSNDAMDSNGYITISGGTIYAFGGATPETSIDCDKDERLSVTGGTIFGIGGATPNIPSKACTQCYAITSFSSSANTTYTVKASNGTEIVSILVPRAYSGGSLVVSSPKMAKNTTYTINSSNSFTTSSTSWITSSGSGNGMGGGNQPGGNQPGGGPGI